jgi:hypothetical protein
MKIVIELDAKNPTRLQAKRLIRLAMEQMCAPEMDEAFAEGKYAEGSHSGKFKWSFS